MKKYNFYRYLFYWMYVVFSIGIPIVLVAQKYAIVVTSAPQKYKVTGMGIIICITLLFYFRSQLKEMVADMEDGTAKTVILESFRVVPILLLYFALKFAEVHMHNFQFIVLWAFVTNCIAVYFRVEHLKFKHLVKELRKELKLNEHD